MPDRDEAPPGALRVALRWAIALGATGFAAGFFGPMVLDPESNIGPIVGILFTGPGGVAAGFVCGLVVGVLENLLGAFVIGNDLKLVVALVLIVGVLLVRPSGFFGSVQVSRV